MNRRRSLLLGVAALLCLSALLAISILLVGRFGQTEGRILGTTMLLAGYGLLGLPAVVLLDQGRGLLLARAEAVVVVVAAALALTSIWSDGGETLGKTVGTASILAVALTQVAALLARAQERDPVLVRRLFAGSCATAALAAAAATALLWADPHGSLWPRLLGALVVLDVLLVALQPVLARARREPLVHRFTVALASGEAVPVSIEGGDLATAAARAIRLAERRGGRVVRVEVSDAAARTRT